MRRLPAWFAMTFLLAASWCAHSKAMDIPWRPIPELPDILWYTEYDETTDMEKKLFDTIGYGEKDPKHKGLQGGGIIREDQTKTPPDPKTKIAWPPWQDDTFMMLSRAHRAKPEDKSVEAKVLLHNTKAKIPGKLNPNHITLYFRVWASEPGRLQIVAKAQKDLRKDRIAIPRVKTWSPIKVSLGVLRDKNTRLAPESRIHELRIIFNPTHAGDNLPSVFIDSLMIGHRQAPERLVMFLKHWQAKMQQLSKTIEKDGFYYDEKMHANMQKLIMGAKGRDTTLVFLPLAEGKNDPSAIWQTAARSARLRDVEFEVAQDPRKLPIFGMDLTRAFLPYLLDKTKPQAGMVVIAKEEALRVGKDVDNLRRVFARLQEKGAAVYLCLPAAEKTNSKLAQFLKAAISLCHELSVPYFDQGFAFKNVKAPYEKGMLTPEGQKALSALLVPGYKHIQDAVSGKRR